MDFEIAAAIRETGFVGNREHMSIALSGVKQWNRWRRNNLRVQPALTRIDLSKRDLRGIDFRGVGLFKANLVGADLRGAILRQSILIQTDLRKTDLRGAHVYGVSVWDVRLDDADQRDLVITPPKIAEISVDNLEVAQFLYLLINNSKLRDVIDTVVSKVVLVLGIFSKPRKPVLEVVREALRGAGFIPVLFDFEGPRSRDLTATVTTLARLSRFIIADLTSPRSVPHELSAIVPELNVPVFPLIQRKEKPYAMFSDLLKYKWVKSPIDYKDAHDVSNRVLPHIIPTVGHRKP